ALGGVPVVDGASVLRLTELLDEPLDGRRRLLGRGRLDRVRQPLGDQHRAALQIAGEALALLPNLEIREYPDDQHHREPDRADEPQGEFHVWSIGLATTVSV